MRRLGKRPGRLDVAVEGGGDDRQTRSGQLFKQCLPPGQVESATSIRRPGDEQHLAPAKRPEVEVGAVEVRQHQVGEAALSSTRPPLRGPSAQRPCASSWATGMPSRRAKSATSIVPSCIARSAIGTQTSPLHAPSGLSSQPVRSSSCSGNNSSVSMITARTLDVRAPSPTPLQVALSSWIYSEQTGAATHASAPTPEKNRSLGRIGSPRSFTGLMTDSILRPISVGRDPVGASEVRPGC
jgi:hypothetical protein